MLKTVGFDEKLELLKPWFEEVIEVVKKDLKNEHLKMDRDFCRRYFLGKNANHVPLTDLAEAYYRDIKEGNGGLGEFIESRWVLKNTDLYDYFANALEPITEDFDKLDVLPEALSHTLIEGSTKAFGATRTYLFAILNSVVFPEALLADLRARAKSETKKVREKRDAAVLEASLEAMQKRHNREIAAVNDRYEKKLRGMEKKYVRDMEILKKQVSQLQKKLSS